MPCRYFIADFLRNCDKLFKDYENQIPELFKNKGTFKKTCLLNFITFA